MPTPRILREPLLHFLVLGVLVFALYGALNGGTRDDNEIVITRGQQINLIDTFERTWRRPPTADEFRSLVQDYVREEIAYGEGTRLELDRNDIVIRRRLRQKLELLSEDLASLAPPSEAELETYFSNNADDYREDAVYSFEHVYLSTDRRGATAEADALELLPRLRQAHSEDVAAIGDSIALPQRLTDTRASEVAALFGTAFAEELARVAPGEWSGPIRSGYGLHLVRVGRRIESRIPDLNEVREDVMVDLLAERRGTAVETLYEGLADNYSIRIEQLADEDAGAE